MEGAVGLVLPQRPSESKQDGRHEGRQVVYWLWAGHWTAREETVVSADWTEGPKDTDDKET